MALIQRVGINSSTTRLFKMISMRSASSENWRFCLFQVSSDDVNLLLSIVNCLASIIARLSRTVDHQSASSTRHASSIASSLHCSVLALHVSAVEVSVFALLLLG